MGNMDTRTGALRTAEEIATVRGYVAEHLEVVRPAPAEFAAVRCEAITAALDWVERHRRNAPFTGYLKEPTERAIAEEMLAAGDREQELLRRRMEATYQGVVHQTLRWVLGDPNEPI